MSIKVLADGVFDPVPMQTILDAIAAKPGPGQGEAT